MPFVGVLDRQAAARYLAALLPALGKENRLRAASLLLSKRMPEFLESVGHRLLRKLLQRYPTPVGAAKLADLAGRLFDDGRAHWTRMPASARCPAMELDLGNALQRKIYFFSRAYAEYYLDGPLARLLTLVLEPGDTFLDIGASLGWFSMHAAKLVGEQGQVVAFEPDPQSYESIVRTARLNRLEQVAAHNLALADHEGRLTFHRDPRGLQSSLVPDARFAEKLEVPVASLDSLLAGSMLDIRRIDFVKIDVEGAEVATLRGMESALQTYGLPRVWCEVRGPDASKRAVGTAEDVVDFMTALGYRPHKFDGDRRGPLAQEDLVNPKSHDILFEK